MKKARLIHAFQWLCPECHGVNMSQHDTITLSEEEMRSAMGLDQWQSIPEDVGLHVEAVPDRGQCKCGEVIELLPPEDWETLEDGRPSDS